MSSVWETQHGLLSEQLRSLVGGKHGTSELTNEQTQRLIVAAYVVLRNHEVNKRGRCRLCYRSRSRWWWPGWRRTCSVHAAFAVALNQPLKVIYGWMNDH